MTAADVSRTYHAQDRQRDDFTLPDTPRVAGLEPYTHRGFDDLRRPNAYLANGMVGLRVAPVPFQHTRAAVNGYVGRSIAEKVEALAPAPSPLGFDLVAGELRLSDALARVEVERQSLEMSFGELTTDLTYHSPAGDVKMSVVTFTPRQLPALACQEITLTADADLAVILEPRLDPVGLPGRCLERIMPGSDVDAVLWWESHGGLSSLGAGFTTEIEGEDDYTSNQNNWGHESLLCLRQYRLRLRPGKPVRLRQYGALIPSTLLPDPHTQVVHVLNFARDLGFNRIRHDNRLAWRELWRGRPRVHGPAAERDGVQAYADSAFFYLHSSASSASHCGLAPFGLSQSEGYYNGHTFSTDLEVYMFPPLLWTQPDAAEALLHYRFAQRDGVHNHATLFGYRGLYYPNQNGFYPGNGSRLASRNATGGATFKNPFVAEAFLDYAKATGDEDFLREYAWPIVRGIADWIVSRCARTERGYEVRNVAINEQYGNTHNEPPVNRSFQRVLHEATDLARRIGRTPRPLWREVAEGMVILTGEADLRRETAWFTQTYKVFERASTREQAIAEMDRLAGVPLNSLQPINSALKLGERDLAAQWWPEEVARHFEPDRFGLWKEWTEMWSFEWGERAAEQACFVAFAGQLLKQLVSLFPRLEVSYEVPGTWPARPVTLPAGWDAIEIERVWVRGEPMRMTAAHGRAAELRPESEAPAG